MKHYKIYKLTAPDNRVYIGMTGKKYLSSRWCRGEGYSECPSIYNAVAQYGWDSFKREVIDETDDEQSAFEKERFWVQYYRSNNPVYGFNLREGGKSGYSLAESTKAKIATSHLGMKHTDEAKKKMSDKAKSRSPASEETRAKISAANTGMWVSPEGRERRKAASTGRKLSEEAKQKIRHSMRCQGNRAKKVRCVETGEVFSSAREASLALGKNKNAVTGAIFSGTACCGKHFEYLTKGVEEVMPISDQKERTNVILPKSLKEKLRKIADEENRSLSNLIITILQEWITNR